MNHTNQEGVEVEVVRRVWYPAVPELATLDDIPRNRAPLLGEVLASSEPVAVPYGSNVIDERVLLVVRPAMFRAAPVLFAFAVVLCLDTGDLVPPMPDHDAHDHERTKHIAVGHSPQSDNRSLAPGRAECSDPADPVQPAP